MSISGSARGCRPDFLADGGRLVLDQVDDLGMVLGRLLGQAIAGDQHVDVGRVGLQCLFQILALLARSPLVSRWQAKK